MIHCRTYCACWPEVPFGGPTQTPFHPGASSHGTGSEIKFEGDVQRKMQELERSLSGPVARENYMVGVYISPTQSSPRRDHGPMQTRLGAGGDGSVAVVSQHATVGSFGRGLASLPGDVGDGMAAPRIPIDRRAQQEYAGHLEVRDQTERGTGNKVQVPLTSRLLLQAQIEDSRHWERLQATQVLDGSRSRPGPHAEMPIVHPWLTNLRLLFATVGPSRLLVAPIFRPQLAWYRRKLQLRPPLEFSLELSKTQSQVVHCPF